MRPHLTPRRGARLGDVILQALAVGATALVGILLVNLLVVLAAR